MATAIPPPPTVSPDGRFYFSDGRWRPLPASPGRVAVGVARGVVYVLATLSICLLVYPCALALSVMAIHSSVPDPFTFPAMTTDGFVVTGGLFALLVRMRP